RRVSRRATGCAQNHRSRRSLATGNAWRLGRRARPDPVHAIFLDEICRRFQRQWPPRPPAQCARCAGLDRQLPGELRLEKRPGLSTWLAELRGAAAVEQERGLHQDRSLFREPARARAVNDAPGNNEGPIVIATGPLPLISCGRSYFAIVLRIALLRCMAQPPLLLSMAS